MRIKSQFKKLSEVGYLKILFFYALLKITTKYSTEQGN